MEIVTKLKKIWKRYQESNQQTLQKTAVLGTSHTIKKVLQYEI